MVLQTERYFDMKKIHVKFKGSTPLMMHNGQLANPFNPFARKLSDLNTEKKRKGVDKLAVLGQMADVEWEGGLYFDAEVGPHIPAMMVRTAIQEGAKLTRGGRTVLRTVNISPPKIPLQYKGPREMEALKADLKFRDQRLVKVQMAKVLRTRPIFPTWSIEFDVIYNEDGIDVKDLVKYIRDAGQFEGLAEGRGKLGMGRFDVEIEGFNSDGQAIAA